MKKALISPIEIITHNDGVQTAYRVAQVSDAAFDVASPFFWIDCANECEQDRFVYVNGEIILKDIWNPAPVGAPVIGIPETYIDGAITGTEPIKL